MDYNMETEQVANRSPFYMAELQGDISESVLTVAEKKSIIIWIKTGKRKRYGTEQKACNGYEGYFTGGDADSGLCNRRD